VGTTGVADVAGPSAKREVTVQRKRFSVVGYERICKVFLQQAAHPHSPSPARWQSRSLRISNDCCYTNNQLLENRSAGEAKLIADYAAALIRREHRCCFEFMPATCSSWTHHGIQRFHRRYRFPSQDNQRILDIVSRSHPIQHRGYPRGAGQDPQGFS
jgi:hypothetical protein